MEAERARWKALLENAVEGLRTPYEMHGMAIGMSPADLVLFRLPEYGSLPSDCLAVVQLLRHSPLQDNSLLQTRWQWAVVAVVFRRVPFPGSGFTEALLDLPPPGEQRGAEPFGRVWRKRDGGRFPETTAKAAQQQPHRMRSGGQRRGGVTAPADAPGLFAQGV